METFVELYSRTVDHKGVRKKRPLATVLLLHLSSHRSQGDGGTDVLIVTPSFDATLICEFGQVEQHACFGKGAVRATRVRHAVTSSTCTDWCLVIFSAVAVAGFCAAAGLAGEQIANMQEELEQVVAAAALAAVPISLQLWICKVFLWLVSNCGRVLGRSCRIEQDMFLA